MSTFTTQSTFHSVASNGVCIGMVYKTREAAETAAEYLNKEWKGQRTFGVKSWEAETFTAHKA
jgi:cation transport regulator ChaC